MKGEKERGGETQKGKGKECEWEKEENNVREEKQRSVGKIKKYYSVWYFQIIWSINICFW